MCLLEGNAGIWLLQGKLHEAGKSDCKHVVAEQVGCRFSGLDALRAGVWADIQRRLRP